MDFSQIEQNLKYTFKDKNLLRRALTLASADSLENNQTLEFFGDAILEFIVSERIFDMGASEGQLTEIRKAIVSDEALTPVSEKLGLDKALIRSAGDTRNKKAIPSAYEAVVAAIYLDGGMDAAKAFVNATLDFSVRAEKHPKCQLLEFLQSRGESCPDFDKCTVDTGSERRHCFKTVLPLFGQTFTGEGDSKSEAQSEAAKKALAFIQSEN
ncbi:MAG: hypothetical protein K2O89_01525 [Clostridia bacterium]|nr:hypothetical protein [Clostridia bacterium]